MITFNFWYLVVSSITILLLALFIMRISFHKDLLDKADSVDKTYVINKKPYVVLSEENYKDCQETIEKLEVQCKYLEEKLEETEERNIERLQRNNSI